MTRIARTLILAFYALVGALLVEHESHGQADETLSLYPPPPGWEVPPSPPGWEVPGAQLVIAPKSAPAGFYAPGTFPREFSAEDHWAYFILRAKELPPLEHDHAFDGSLLVIVVGGSYGYQSSMHALCAGFSFDGRLLGCAMTGHLAKARGADCVIVIADDDYLAAHGRTRNLVLRHEVGHCNGWKDHAGAR